MTKNLDGKVLADQIRAEVSAAAQQLRTSGTIPTLAIVVATDNQDAAWYVRAITKTANACGISCRLIDRGARATTKQLAEALEALANDRSVHGIVLQTPLPLQASTDQLLELIPPEKDIDGANPTSAGRLSFGIRNFPPATAEAIMITLDHYGLSPAGKHAVVIGRSRVVGKPVAQLLLAANATVTICHSRTTDLVAYTRSADIVVVAAGQPGLLGPGHVGHQTVVIDVGTTVNGQGLLVGDVEPAATDIVRAFTPVPGGIGPVTTAVLLRHTIMAAGAPITTPADQKPALPGEA